MAANGVIGDPLSLSLLSSASSIMAGRQRASRARSEHSIYEQEERISAKEREVERERELQSILAAQNVQIGASGLVNEGSFTALQKDTKHLFDLEQRKDTAATQRRIGYSRQRSEYEAKSARLNSVIQAGGSLLDYVDRTSRRGRINTPSSASSSSRYGASYL